jgi:hypothetical protein
MKLEQLRRNLLEVPEGERLHFFSAYYEGRNRDLEKVVIKVPEKRAKGKKPSERKICVTPDQLATLRKLGLV